MRVGNKGGVTTACDTDEAKNAQTPQARRKNRKKYSKLSRRESNQTEVLESMKGIGSTTANAHLVGIGHAADT